MFTDFRYELASSRHQKLLAEAAAQRLGRPDPTTRPERVAQASPLVGRILRRFAGPVGIWPRSRNGAGPSESTAGVHVSNILGKLGVTSRTEAASVAVRHGLAD